jgi:hypothetical protein
MQKVLRNAIFGPNPAAATAATSSQRSSAAKAAAALPTLDSPLRLTVTSTTAAAAEGVLQSHGASYSLKSSGGKARFLIANEGDLSGEEHPYSGLLPEELERAGVEVLAFRAP